jgi:hypothetical protein
MERYIALSGEIALELAMGLSHDKPSYLYILLEHSFAHIS